MTHKYSFRTFDPLLHDAPQLCGLCRENRNVVVQQSVQPRRIDCLVRIAGHLAPRMDAPVGAPRDPQPQRTAVEARLTPLPDPRADWQLTPS